MEDTLNRLKSLSALSPRGIQLPNCDKKGFYKKKQVSPRSPPLEGSPSWAPLPAPSPPPPVPCSPLTTKGPRRANTFLLSRAGQPGPHGAWEPLRVTSPSLLRPQCRPAKGRKRGLCWCVDKYGQPLPGHDPPGKPDVHCDSVESQ